MYLNKKRCIFIVTKSETMNEVAEHIKENGGYIKDAGQGRQWNAFPSGKKINTPRLRYLVRFGGLTVARQTEDAAFVALHGKGKLNLFDFGFNTCPKCGGSGKVASRIDHGICFKCHGYGLIK